MKKIFALALAAVMLLGCMSVAMADEVLVFKTEGTEKTNSFVEEWAGEYKLVAYYIGEEFAEDNDMEGAGLTEIESDVTLTMVAGLDAAATGSDAGVMVDQAAYFHAHVYDAQGTLTVGDTEIAINCPWDGWTFEVPGEGVCNYLSAVGKMNKAVKGEVFEEITGLENDGLEEKMNYIGMTEDGMLVIAYSDANLVKKGNSEEIGFALVFAPIDAE